MFYFIQPSVNAHRFIVYYYLQYVKKRFYLKRSNRIYLSFEIIDENIYVV